MNVLRSLRHVVAAWLALLPLTPALFPAAQAQDPSFPTFVDAAMALGLGDELNLSGSPGKNYIVETIGNGAAFFDYDNDGDVDLLVTNGSTLENLDRGGDSVAHLFRNDEGEFSRLSDAGISGTGWAVGVCVGDYDNDGNDDFYVTAYGPNILYRNKGDGTFEERTLPAGVGDDRWGTNCAFGDYDRDGFIDLYVANYMEFSTSFVPHRESGECGYMGASVMCGPSGDGQADVLYHNNGDGTFEDVSVEAGIDVASYYGFGVLFGDFDADGWPDIYVANDGVPNLMFRNDHDGTFTDVSFLSGTAMSDRGDPQSGMGVAASDYDADGDLDIFVTNFAADTNTLYQNIGPWLFREVTASSRLAEASLPNLGWGVDFADLDNDGITDIFVANGHVYPQVDDLDVGQSYRQRKEVYRGLADHTFVEIVDQVGEDLLERYSARGLAVADYDNDGDLDVFVTNIDDVPNLYRNDGGNRRNWLSLELEGTTSNRNAIGARVEVEAGGAIQTAEVRSGESFLSHNDFRLHFGLGDHTEVESLRVRWPSGEVETFEAIPANEFVTIREGDGGYELR